MGKWADEAAARFFSQLGQQRQSNELELIRHHRLVAGAEQWWAKLRKFIIAETNAFNKQTRPDFFQVEDSETRVEVVAPMGTLKCSYDSRTPTIRAELELAASMKPKTFHYGFVSHVNNQGQETIQIVNAEDTTTSTVEVIGAQLLNPLVA